MKFREIIVESRVDDFKSKYTQKFGSQNVERIVNMVEPKYLDWAGKNIDNIDFDNNYGKLVAAIKEFDKISNNLPITDITQYKSLEQLSTALEEHKNKQRRDVEKHEGGNVVYNDDKFYVVNPLTHEASCYYGRGTKWCTAATGDEHFKRYNGEGKLFYVIDKTKQTSDPLYKVAILRNFDDSESYWDAQDESFKTGWILGTEEFEKINNQIKNYLEQEFSEQLKIFRDKELAKKEKERLRRVELQRILDRKTEEANERRLDGEWELGPDCPEIGIKAHALLEWLSDNNDVDVLTEEDKVEIQRLKSEIERLNNEYDADEETRTDLLDEISEFEDELTELEEKIDVYNIIPAGTHYDMTTFDVINAGLDGREYAVGDEDDMQSSCHDYVDQLIDDIGYEGFSQGFAEDYVDKDQVRNYAEDFYYDDVSDNPEAFFDDEDRELSDRQNDIILQNKTKIEKTEMMIERLQSQIDDIEDEDEIEELEEKIQELTDEIEELNDEIQEMEDNPEGDFSEDKIQDKADELANDAAHDPVDWLKEMGMDIDNFIDREDFIQGVIDADGYGNTLNSYDGNADEVKVNDTWYYVMRIN